VRSQTSFRSAMMIYNGNLTILKKGTIVSGRIYGEFFRLLYILAHRRTLKYFANMGEDENGTDDFTWRRSQYLEA
jgi:hypothetical protein